MKWIPCGNGFIEEDVIHWKEVSWEKHSPRRTARAVNAAEVLLAISREFGKLLEWLLTGEG